jgi:hypothetical protein
MSAPNVHPHGELHNPDTAHEATDINLRAIVSFAIVLAAVTLTIQVAMFALFHVFARMASARDQDVSPIATQADQAPSEPRLQTTPWADLKALRAEEFSYLHSYGWIDQQRGVAHLPIEKAEALLLQRGMPVRPGPVDPTEGTSIAATGEASGGRNLPAAGPDKSGEAAPKSPQAAKPGGQHD